MQGNTLCGYKAVQPDIPDAALYFLGNNLRLLSKGVGFRLWGKAVQLSEDGNRQVEKALALADKISSRVHGQAIGEQQTDRHPAKLLRRNLPPVLNQPLVSHGIDQVLEGYLIRLQEIKTLLQAGRRNQQLLAVGQGVDPDLLQSRSRTDKYPLGLLIPIKTTHQLRGFAGRFPLRRIRKIRPHRFFGNHGSPRCCSLQKKNRQADPVGFFPVMTITLRACLSYFPRSTWRTADAL